MRIGLLLVKLELTSHILIVQLQEMYYFHGVISVGPQKTPKFQLRVFALVFCVLFCTEVCGFSAH